MGLIEQMEKMLSISNRHAKLIPEASFVNHPVGIFLQTT